MRLHKPPTHLSWGQMTGEQNQSNTVIVKVQNNVLGNIAMICSLVGLLITGGLLCPVGLVLGIIALKKEPKGTAITGVVVGAIGSLFLVVMLLIFGAVVFTFCCSCIGLGGLAAQSAERQNISKPAAQAIYAHYEETGSLPDDATGEQIVAAYTHDGQAFKYDVGSTMENFLILHPGKDGKWDTPDDWSVDWDLFDFQSAEPNDDTAIEPPDQGDVEPGESNSP